MFLSIMLIRSRNDHFNRSRIMHAAAEIKLNLQTATFAEINAILHRLI
jgi:hypothetical protein